MRRGQLTRPDRPARRGAPTLASRRGFPIPVFFRAARQQRRLHHGPLRRLGTRAERIQALVALHSHWLLTVPCSHAVWYSAQPVSSAASGRSHRKSARPVMPVHLDHRYQPRVPLARIQARMASRVRRGAWFVLAGANAELALPRRSSTPRRSNSGRDRQ